MATGHKVNVDDILRACRLRGERWMGTGQDFATMIGYTGTNGTWQKIITAGDLGDCFIITKIFAYDPSQDDITRIQLAMGDNAEAEYAAGNYTEAMIKFDGTNYKCQDVTMGRCECKDIWIRPIVNNNPGNDATINFFVCIQDQDV